MILTYLANTFGRLNKLSAVDQFIMVKNYYSSWFEMYSVKDKRIRSRTTLFNYANLRPQLYVLGGRLRYPSSVLVGY